MPSEMDSWNMMHYKRSSHKIPYLLESFFWALVSREMSTSLSLSASNTESDDDLQSRGIHTWRQWELWAYSFYSKSFRFFLPVERSIDTTSWDYLKNGYGSDKCWPVSACCGVNETSRSPLLLGSLFGEESWETVMEVTGSHWDLEDSLDQSHLALLNYCILGLQKEKW